MTVSNCVNTLNRLSEPADADTNVRSDVASHSLSSPLRCLRAAAFVRAIALPAKITTHQPVKD